jgi:hypothetical protein
MPWMKTDWGVTQTEDGLVVEHRETRLTLWLLDRWFRIPDAIFDWIEWRFPATASVSKVPCLLYSRWFPELVVRQIWTEYRVADGSVTRDQAANPSGSTDREEPGR